MMCEIQKSDTKPIGALRDRAQADLAYSKTMRKFEGRAIAVWACGASIGGRENPCKMAMVATCTMTSLKCGLEQRQS